MAAHAKETQHSISCTACIGIVEGMYLACMDGGWRYDGYRS